MRKKKGVRKMVELGREEGREEEEGREGEEAPPSVGCGGGAVGRKGLCAEETVLREGRWEGVSEKTDAIVGSGSKRQNCMCAGEHENILSI
jgi:hypothetical protein